MAREAVCCQQEGACARILRTILMGAHNRANAVEGVQPRSGLSSLYLLLLLLPFALPAQAQFLTRPVSLAELTQRAAIVVQGRVLEAVYEGHPDYPNVSTVRVTLQVEQMIRGDRVERFTFREFLPGLMGQRGKRGYAAGQRLLLFLPRPSQYGLSSPLGGEQGRFRILRDAEGKELIVNDLGNAGLFRDVPDAVARAGLRLSPAEERVAASVRGAVPLADFLSLVERLSKLPRVQ